MRRYSRLASYLSPSAKLGHVAEAMTLHVLIGNLDHKFRPQGLPGKILALAPAALAARACAAQPGSSRYLPRSAMDDHRVRFFDRASRYSTSSRRFSHRETRANAHVLQRA